MHSTATKAAVPPAALTVREAAEYLRSSPTSIYRMFARGDLPKAKVGGKTLVRRVDADMLLARAAGMPTGGDLFD
jgi:excisionase family DNA binding protein